VLYKRGMATGVLFILAEQYITLLPRGVRRMDAEMDV
jgi:hypothetical protein